MTTGVSPREIFAEGELKRMLAPKEIRLYLSHPNESRFTMREWELDFEELTGIDLVNPFYDRSRFTEKELFSGEIDITEDKSPEGVTYLRYKPKDPRKLVEVDIRDVLLTWGSVTVIDENPQSKEESYGTIQEMVYGTLFHKKIFALVTNGYEKHPWIKYHSSEIYTNINDLEKSVIGWALGLPKK